MSWQATLFCLALRWTVKRAAAGPLDVARARAKIGTPGRRALRVPAGVIVSTGTVNGRALERIDIHQMGQSSSAALQLAAA